MSQFDTLRERVYPKNDQLAAAEEAFTDYFLAKLGPNRESELKRASIFKKIKRLIEKALGK